MKKTIFVLLSWAVLMSIAFPLSALADSKISNSAVYICTGKSATKFHSRENCSGLSHCGSEIQKTTRLKAQNGGKTNCGICWKKVGQQATPSTTAAKKSTTATKATSTKATTAGKSAPARDEKGRFVSTKKTQETTTATKKATTATKKAATTTKKAAETTKTTATKAKSTTTATKSAPARDEKGRFISTKKTETGTTTKKTTTGKKAA